MNDMFENKKITAYVKRTKSQVGVNIRVKRKALNLTVDQLSEYIGVSSNFLGDVERGVKHLSLSTLLKLSWFFGCTIDELVQGGENHSGNAGRVLSKMELLGLTGARETQFFLSFADILHEYLKTI